MKFATIGHIIDSSTIELLPSTWIHDRFIISPEININGTKGFFTGLKLNPQQMMNLPRGEVRKEILDISLFLQDEFDVDLIQLGALTTSVTSGGIWLSQQDEYKGYVNHGDSYTAAVACQTVRKAINLIEKNLSNLCLAIVGAYGIIGEAVSKILVPQFDHSILIGPNEQKLIDLKQKIKGSFRTSVNLDTSEADIIVTATSHPESLLFPEHLKKNAIIIDVSMPPNLSYNICQSRPDILRCDGGYVDFPSEYNATIPAIPQGKLFSCIVEVIMQAMENELKNHVGSIEIEHLKKTERWGKKYGFIINELTNFGNPIQSLREKNLNTTIAPSSK